MKMQNIDPEQHKRLIAVISDFNKTCNRMRDAATSAKTAMADMSYSLDVKLRKASAKTASKIMKRMKNKQEFK